MAGALITLIHNEARRIWCYRRLALATATLIFFLAATFILTMPKVYDAWGQVYVSKDTAVTAATQGVGLVGQDYGSGTFIAKVLLNEQGLEKVVRRINPRAATMSKAEMALAIRRLKNQIKLTPDAGDGFFEFHTRDPNPRRAHLIVKALLDEFVSRNVTRNQRELRQAGDFLDSQIASYETMLAQSRDQLVDFQRRHPGFLAVAPIAPDPAGGIELAEAHAAYNQALAEAGGPGRAGSGEEAVAALEAKLATLRTQYTEQYPDVVAAERQLAQAIAQRDALARAPRHTSPALAAARRRLLSAQIAASPRTRAAPDPAIQAEWAELQKSDEVLRANYQQLMSKREAARMSQAVYGPDGSGKYQITRAPTVPDLPIGPNLGLYLLLAAVAAIGSGLGVAYLRAAIQGIFVSPRELEQVFELPVVGTVSWEPAWSTDRQRDGGALGWLRNPLRGALPSPRISSNVSAS